MLQVLWDKGLFRSFTGVDPFEDTESAGQYSAPIFLGGFTGVDPFEDTESSRHKRAICVKWSFTGVDPFEDTESSLSVC